MPSAAVRPLLSALDALTPEHMVGALSSGGGLWVGRLAAACRACQALAQQEGLIRRACSLPVFAYSTKKIISVENPPLVRRMQWP